MKIIIRNILFILPVLAGFCLIVNRPLMAQLPGGDDGNHKDKPGYKVADSTETDKNNKTPTTSPGTAATDAEAKTLAAMPLDALVGKVKSVADVKEKQKYTVALANRKSANQKEVEYLFTVIDGEEEFPKPDLLRNPVADSLSKVTDPLMGAVFAKRITKGRAFSRWVAIKMVGMLKHKEAVPGLIEIIDGKEVINAKTNIAGLRLQLAATAALGEIGDERAIPVLLKQLGKMHDYETNALAKFGKKAAPQLLEILRTSKDEDKSSAAGNTLGLMKDKELIPEMWRIFKDENDPARYTAKNVLLNITDKTTSPTADEVMDYIVINAKTNPAMLSDVIDVARRRKDIPYLIKTFQDASVPHNLRTAAIGFLEEFRAESAVPALQEALKDPDREIRDRAAYSLERITGKKYDGGLP